MAKQDTPRFFNLNKNYLKNIIKIYNQKFIIIYIYDINKICLIKKT